MRPAIINFLRGQRQQDLYGTMINRLKLTNTVIKHTDVNAPNIAPGTVLSAVNGEPVRIDAINERMKAYIYKFEMRIYDAQKQALDRRINDLLVIAEANKRHIGSEEIMRAEISDKIKPATEAEIAKFYQENKSRINVDLASARASIASYLEQQQQEKLETALADRLRAAAKVMPQGRGHLDAQVEARAHRDGPRRHEAQPAAADVDRLRALREGRAACVAPGDVEGQPQPASRLALGDVGHGPGDPSRW